jgi:hypothetical protein
MSQLNWREWTAEELESAKKTGRPLLLFLKASWCPFSKKLQAVLEDSSVVDKIEKSYVPFRVDKDRRPEINLRYNLGGWPTLAFLTPDGEIITGGSSLTEEEVRSLVDRVADYYSEHREQIHVDLDRIVAELEEQHRVRQSRTGELGPEIVDKVAGLLLDAFDRKYGGFGTGQKFPHPEAIDFAILYYAKTHNPAYREVVQKTLTAMAEGRLADPEAGGFFRFCATRDWRQPHTEKLLETQAGLLRNFLEAHQLFDRPDFKKVASKVLAYVEDNLSDADAGGYYGSQDADDEFYSLDPQEQRDRKAPRVEPTCYSPSVAQMVSSLLKCGSVLQDSRIRDRGLAALHFLLERCYSQGRGMYHYYDGHRHILGLLTDQIYTARAIIHAIQYTGDNDYLPILEDLITTIVKKQAATHGGFYDISEDDATFGSLRRRNTSLMENSLMAEVLIRAHCLTARAEYLELAEKTLRSFAADYQLYGYFTAGYARAVELFFHHPIRIVVVGKADDPARQRILEVAQGTYLPSKVILAIDPDNEPELLQRHSFPADSTPVAYLCLERACVAEIRDPELLASAMREAEDNRIDGEARH